MKNAKEDATTEVVKATGTALEIVDFGDDVGAGLENITQEERTLPFVKILQKGSPQVDPSHPNYQTKKIRGATPGMILKSNTNEVFNVMSETEGSHPLIMLPAHRDRNFVEYWPRPKQGEPAPAGQGFVGIRAADDPLVLELLAKQGRFKKLLTPQGTELTDTWYLYSIFIASLGKDVPPYVFPGVMGFASTQIPYYKTFISTVTDIKYPSAKGGFTKPPMWAHRWELSTFPDSNKKSRENNGGFFSPRLALADGASPANPRPALVKMDNEYYVMAKELYEVVRSGKVKADYASNDETDKPSDDLDKDIPF